MRKLAAALATLATAALLTACNSDGGNPIPGLTLQTLNNRPDLVSGGSALVQVNIPSGGGLAELRFELDGADVTSAFSMQADGRVLGLLKGLKNGNNTLSAFSTVASLVGAQLVITNYPASGPVLLATQTTPWICATPTPVAASGNTPRSNASGLSTAAIDAQCTIATEYKLFYRTTTAGCSNSLPDPSPPAAAPTNNCFKPYTVGSKPADLATTTTTTGLVVPYIVRVERGTINRGIYDIAVLFDPTVSKPWTALAKQPQWNGKVVYSFGASTGFTRLQYRTEQNWADDTALSRGFMVVDNSLSDSLYNANRVLNAETVMMMKDYITKAYGEIKYTVGNGCSGGSIGQNTASSIYPGLLDGIQPSCDYPDSITTGLEVVDCVLLANFYASPAWATLQAGLTPDQINAKKALINGHLDQTACHGWYTLFGSTGQPGNYVPMGVLDNTSGAVVPIGGPKNNCELPAALVYDAKTNPTGTRCGDADLSAAVWGTTAGATPGSTRALTTTDNVGVQYGLKALMAGSITPEEFVTLNEKIGGLNADSLPSSARSVADAAALPIAYRSGIVGSGKNFGKLPIIDSRGYDEVYGNLSLAQYGIHLIWRSFAERARIDAANANNHGNQVMWRYWYSLTPVTPAQVAAVTVQSFLTMDTWLSNLNTSAPKSWLNAERTQAAVIAAKPVGTVDLCYLTGDINFSTPVTDMSTCDADPRLAKHASPRQVAGGLLAEDVLKCQLKSLSVTDYAPITFTPIQLIRLSAAFPDGVCDWSKPGVGQQDATAPLSFKAGPGGLPLPAVPVSTPL